MKTTTRLGRYATLLVAGGLLLPACDLEVLNPGRILDEDLTTPELMGTLANGVAAEFNDIVDAFAFTGVARLTDDIAGTGSYFSTGKFRRGEFDNEDSEGYWEQAHEGAWAAEQAWTRISEVLGAEANNFAPAARVFMLEGYSHRFLGENFCDMVYRVGDLLPREAAFDEAIDAFQQAIQIGTAAGATEFVTGAYAGIAQAEVGRGNWGAAVAAAANVPTDFEVAAIYHPTANSNAFWNETHGRAEVGLWGTPAMMYTLDDPAEQARAPWTQCGSWNDPNVPPNEALGVTPTGLCAGSGSGAHQGADGLTAHYRQDKYPDQGSDIPVGKGTEMRLIEAEDALLRGDLAGFTAKVNVVRAHYGLAPIAQPATAGALEWIQGPLNGLTMQNALDDAWSILDKERYMTLWIEGRRMWDLDRWNHPFLDGGGIIGPGEPRRVSCMPIPEIECTLNPNIQNSSACT